MRSLIKLYHRASRREDSSGEASIRARDLSTTFTIDALIINNHLHICDTVARLQYNPRALGLSLYRPIIVASSGHCLPFPRWRFNPIPELSITWINGSRLTAWLLRVFPPIKMCSLEISTLLSSCALYIQLVYCFALQPFVDRFSLSVNTKCWLTVMGYL